MRLPARFAVRRAFAVALAAALAATPAAAYAAGYFLPGIGVRSMARGTAITVNGDSPLVMYENVALLARVKGLVVTVDVNVVNQWFDYQRTPDQYGSRWANLAGNDAAGNPCRDNPLSCPNATPTTPEADRAAVSLADGAENRLFRQNELERLGGAPTTQYAGVSNRNVPFPIPLLMASWDMNTDNWVLGFGLYGPSRGNTRLPATGPQRYLMHRQDVFQVNAQLSLAGEFWDDRIQVGLGAIYATTWLNQQLSLASTPIRNVAPELATGASSGVRWLDPDLDVQFSVNPQDWTQFGATAGFRINPVAGFAVAGSVFYMMDVDAAGTFSNKLPPSLASSAKLIGDSIRIRVAMPLIARFGIGWEEKGKWDIELTGVYEGWGRHRDIRISYPNGVTIQPTLGGVNVPAVNLPPIRQLKTLQDAWSLRLGSSWHVLPGTLVLRAGGYYESTAVPEKSMATDAIDSGKFGVGAGFTYTIAGVDIDFGLQYVYLMPITVKNTQRFAINPVDEGFTREGEPAGTGLPGRTNIPGALGRYDGMQYLIGGVGLTLHFDEFFKFGPKHRSRPAAEADAPAN